MRNTKQINLIESRQEIASIIRSVFGETFSQKDIEDWRDILIAETDSNQYERYTIECTKAGALFFAQYGEKEYYHDGSSQPRKFVCIMSISGEEYAEAKKKQCELESDYHEYRNGWLRRGEERFFTYWQGRFSDYIYYAKKLSGLPFVKVTIETLY